LTAVSARRCKFGEVAFLPRMTKLGQAKISDITEQIRVPCADGNNEAQLVDENKFGQYYELFGILHGPSGVDLQVRTIWMRESLSGVA